jgi:NADP-dependent 3-hydroxy acid dehydrogenase YdfG
MCRPEPIAKFKPEVTEGVAEPLTADDVAEAAHWSVMLPHHFNIDLMVIRPLAQAAQHKVFNDK